jgi:ATP-dependent DNA helicase RecG
MTKTELLETIANGENSIVEFKNDSVEPHRIARELVGFLNSHGGTLLLGVEDDGSVSGITRPKIGDWLTTICRDLIRPEVVPLIEILREVEPGKSVAAVRLDRGFAVHHVWRNNSRTYFIRANDQTREASPEELQLLFQRRGSLRAELGAVGGADIASLDLRRLADYFGRVREQQPPPLEDSANWTQLLVNTELMTESESGVFATVAGLLLFGSQTDKHLPYSGIDAVSYKGKVKEYDTRDRAYLRGPMTALGAADRIVDPGLVEQAMDFARAHLNLGETLVGDTRRDRAYRLPLAAVREAVVNAVVHRDYLLTATNVELSIYSDRLEVISPGRPPNGITPDRMRIGCRAARNQLLKDTMRDYGYLEHMGMGIPRKMFAAMNEVGLPEPELKVGEESFKVTLRW